MQVNKITEHFHPHAKESHSSSHVTEISARWEYLTSPAAWHPYLQQTVHLFWERRGQLRRAWVDSVLSGLTLLSFTGKVAFDIDTILHFVQLLKSLPEFPVEPAISWIKFAILVNAKSSSTWDRGDAWVQIPWAQVKNLNQFRCRYGIPVLLRGDGRVEAGECPGGQ